MTDSVPARADPASPLGRQQADFTAEGAPPPGTVAGHVPDSAADRPVTAPAAAADLPARRPAGLR